MTVDPGAPGTPMSERMQSLLSRAVEDQLSEQRQLAGILAEVRAQLQRIASDVADLRGEQSSGPSVDVSEAMLASVSADVREAVRLLGERLDGVARLVQQRGQDLAELRAVTSELQSAVRGQGEALAGVSSGLAALPAFGERIGGLQDNLAQLHTRLATLDEMNGTAGVLHQRVEHLAQELRELRSAFAGIGARIAELPGRSDFGAAVDAAATRSTQPLSDVLGRLEGVQAQVGQLKAQVAAVADTLAEPADADADARFARLESSLRAGGEATQQRLAALEDRLGEVAAALGPAEADTAEAEPEEPAEDPVLAELGELWEALFGDEGLAARLEAAGGEDVDARVGAAVEQAVAAAEQRLTAHIDEAVLALAEALLRRRTPRSPLPARPDMPPPAAPEPAADAAQAPQEEVAEEAPDAGPGTPWQTPPTAVATPAWRAEADPGGDPEDADRRRRPWWRPGD
jgi:chromosome segregation ATPase